MRPVCLDKQEDEEAGSHFLGFYIVYTPEILCTLHDSHFLHFLII